MANSPASDIVEEAIQKALPMMGDYKEGDILVDWVVVAYCANADNETGGAYPMLYSTGSMPEYKALGLLNTAQLLHQKDTLNGDTFE